MSTNIESGRSDLDEQTFKQTLRKMALEDPTGNPAIHVYRAYYEREYGETPWEDDD